MIFFKADPKERLKIIALTIDKLQKHGYPKIQEIPLRVYPDSEHLRTYESRFLPSEPSKIFSACSGAEPYWQDGSFADEVARCYDLFFLNKPFSKESFYEVLGKELTDKWRDLEVIKKQKQGYRFLFRLAPVGSRIYFCSAFDRGLSHFTYLSYDSIVFRSLVIDKWQRKVAGASILDFCCGSGFVGLEIQGENDWLTGVDISPSAIEFARINNELYGKPNNNFMVNERPEGPPGVDLAVCNPPFVFLPESERQQVDSYGGGDYGLEMTIKSIKWIAGLLGKNGAGFVITRSPLIDGRLHIMDALNKHFPRLVGKCYELSPALGPIEDWEHELGIEDYIHCLVSFSLSDKPGAEQNHWEHVPLVAEERYRYAF